MSVPDTPRPPPSRSGWAAGLLLVAGIVMLLPGLCVVGIAVLALPGQSGQMLRQIGDPQFLVVLVVWALFWLSCLAISYQGLKLIRRAFR